MKRAVAYIGSPRQFQDFIWYYLAYGKEYEWDLVCQPMVKEMKLEETFKRSGLFRNIYVFAPFWGRSLGELVQVGSKMILYWLMGQNKKYARKEINKIINLNKYEHICLATTEGVFEGMMALCADQISVDLLEDGLGDNPDPHEKFNIYRLKENRYLISYVFAKMGYFNYRAIFPLKSTKKCIRYSINPEIVYRELYKEVRQLNDMTLVDRDEYTDLVKKAFGINQVGEKFDAVLFSTPLTDFTQDCRYYNKRILEYLKEQGYHKILLKKHPRDVFDYKCEDLEIIETDSWIPGENLLEALKGYRLFFMAPSSTIRAIKDRSVNICIFKYPNLKNSDYSYLFDRVLSELTRSIDIEHIQIVDI